MVLNRINLLVAGGNEGGKRSRQVPLEEEGEPGAGTATACCLALPPVLHLFLAWADVPDFLVLFETGNKVNAPQLHYTLQFQARI